jgi:hypothetical protein
MTLLEGNKSMYTGGYRTMAAAVRCNECRRPLTAEHVVHDGVHHCYGCDLRLLKAHDLAWRPGRLPGLHLLRRRRPGGPRPAIPARPVYGVAARRPGSSFVRRLPRAVP